MPQAALVLPGWQLPPASQHPVAHEEAPQVCGAWHPLFWHCSAPWQTMQGIPPPPQAPLSVPAMQVSFWQQPVGQVVESQGATQVPLLQASPGLQLTQAAPPAPQSAGMLPATHCPAALQHP